VLNLCKNNFNVQPANRSGSGFIVLMMPSSLRQAGMKKPSLISTRSREINQLSKIQKLCDNCVKSAGTEN
jgi:hypothetical protein